MLRLQQPIKELSIPPKVFCGNRERWSTSTAISFITENLFIVAAFNSRNIYLIEIKNDEFITLDVVKAAHHPDVSDYKDGIIALSAYPYNEPNGWVLLYKIENNKLIHIKDVLIPITKVHGVEILNKDVILYTSNSVDSRGVYFLNVNTEEKTKFNIDILYFPKDVFIINDKILIVTSESMPEIGSSVVIKKSILYLFTLSGDLLSEMPFNGQTDSLTLNGENGFISVQGDDTLVHFTLKEKSLTFIKRIKGFSFPHGIDSISDVVGVTNYGDNSIHIYNINELI